MTGKLEVSFNSPQCGWMAIGFEDGVNEFHTTTSHAPYVTALGDLLDILTATLDNINEEFSQTLKWNRDPEAFDFVFRKKDSNTSIEIIEYPSEEREQHKSETVFAYEGDSKQIADAFYETFKQLHEERNVDEFELNWFKKFPFEKFQNLSKAIADAETRITNKFPSKH